MTFNVKVVREFGINLITDQLVERAEEDMIVEAVNLQKAHRIALIMTTLKFSGQVMRVYIDGKEHLDEKI